MAEKANLKYGHELKQTPEAAKKRKQSRLVPVGESLSVSSSAAEGTSSASVVAPAGQPASLPPDLHPKTAAAAGAHMFESLGCVAVGAESIAADASSSSASASASTRSSGVALSIVSSSSDGAAGAANDLLPMPPLSTASPMSSSSTSASSAGVEHQNQNAASGGGSPGGASGAQVPRKSSMKKRAPVSTMASVSEREERDRPEPSESDLVNRRLSNRSLAKSLLSRYEYMYISSSASDFDRLCFNASLL